MKKLVSIIILLSLSCLTGYGQVDQGKGFSFQGVARDNDGKALANEEIDIRFKIIDSEAVVAFSEEHNLTTDPYGVFVATIGSTGGSFKDIDFSADDYTLKVEIKIGSEWKLLNEQEFKSVPYAKTADYAHNSFFPPGIIVPFAGKQENVPEGWVLCDGAAYSKTDYEALFNVIGYLWGKEEDNFRVPDLRGVFLRGVTYSRSDDYRDPEMDNRTRLYQGEGGVSNDVGTFQDDRFENHTHWLRSDHKDVVEFLNEEGDLIDHSDGGGNIKDLPRPEEVRTWDVYEQEKHGPETRPKNAYVNYIIKL